MLPNPCCNWRSHNLWSEGGGALDYFLLKLSAYPNGLYISSSVANFLKLLLDQKGTRNGLAIHVKYIHIVNILYNE